MWLVQTEKERKKLKGKESKKFIIVIDLVIIFNTKIIKLTVKHTLR